MDHPEHYEDMMPLDAIPMFGFRVAAFYDNKGRLAYATSLDQDGSNPIPFLIGVLEMCKTEVANFAVTEGEAVMLQELEDEGDDV